MRQPRFLDFSMVSEFLQKKDSFDPVRHFLVIASFVARPALRSCNHGRALVVLLKSPTDLTAMPNSIEDWWHRPRLATHFTRSLQVQSDPSCDPRVLDSSRDYDTLVCTRNRLPILALFQLERDCLQI